MRHSASLIVLVAMVACGKGDKAEPTGAAPPGSDPSSAKPSAGDPKDKISWGDCAALLTSAEVEAACGKPVKQTRWFTQGDPNCVRVYRDPAKEVRNMEPPLPADILLNVMQVMGEPQGECDGGTQVAGIGNFACQIEGRIDVIKGRYRFWIGSPGRRDGDPPACPEDKLPELARLVVKRLPSS